MSAGRWRVQFADVDLVVQDVSRRRWLDAIDTTRLVSTQTRLLLRQYADRMPADGLVWEPREEIAERLGVTTRTVQRAFVAARRAGLLRYVSGGWNGRTTEHQASCPVIGEHDVDRLPSSPTPPWETRRETVWGTKLNSLPVSLRPTGRETPGVSPREEESERSERVAVDRSAAHEPTTTEPAPAATSCSAKGGNEEEGRQDTRPSAAAPSTTAPPHAGRPKRVRAVPRDWDAAHEPVTTQPATHATPCSPNSGNDDRSGYSLPLNAPVTTDLPQDVLPAHVGPCLTCRRPTQRYGPGGLPRCVDCRVQAAVAQ